MIPQVDLFSFIFWEKLKAPKRHFEINWPLAYFHFWIFISVKFYKHLTLMYNAIDQPRLECVFIKGKVYKNWSFFLFIWCGPPTEGRIDFLHYGKPWIGKNIYL